MAGDDTDPLFKNVPRRPRSAASAHDSDGTNVSNNASPPATSTGGGGAEHDIPKANHKKHRLAPIDEEPEEPEDGTNRDVVGALEKKATASPSASSGGSEADADDDVDWAAAENERRRQCQLRRKGKGKMPVVDEDSDADVARRRRPPPAPGGSPGLCNGNKLLGDAIRSHHFRSTAAAGFEPPPSGTKQPKKPKTKESSKPTTAKDSSRSSSSNGWPFWFGPGTGRNGMSWAGSDVDHSFATIPIVSDRLRATLTALGVTTPPPVRVYGKLLTRCDRDAHEARLLMSFKSWRRRRGSGGDDVQFPPCAFLTGREREEVHEKDGTGLALTAYDRGGDAYEVRFRYLDTNEGYRVICRWTEFLRRNGLVVVRRDGPSQAAAVGDDVMVDLWMFRSPAPEGNGKVGMVMLHYRRGDAPHADAALDEVEQKKRRRQGQLMLNNNGGGVGAGGNDDDAVMQEDVEGDANGGEGGGGGEPLGNKVADAPPPALSEPEGGPAGAPSTSSELHGGGGGRRRGEVSAPLLSLGLLGGGGGTEEEQEAGGGAVRGMPREVEAAAQQSSLVAAPPSVPGASGGAAAAAAMRRMTAAELAEAELQAAQRLVMLSEAA